MIEHFICYRPVLIYLIHTRPQDYILQNAQWHLDNILKNTIYYIQLKRSHVLGKNTVKKKNHKIKV